MVIRATQSEGKQKTYEDVDVLGDVEVGMRFEEAAERGAGVELLRARGGGAGHLLRWEEFQVVMEWDGMGGEGRGRGGDFVELRWRGGGGR